MYFKYLLGALFEYIAILLWYPNFDIQISRISFLLKTRKQLGSNQLCYTDTEIINTKIQQIPKYTDAFIIVVCIFYKSIYSEDHLLSLDIPQSWTHSYLSTHKF